MERVIRHIAKNMKIMLGMEDLAKNFSPEILANILIERAKLEN